MKKVFGAIYRLPLAAKILLLSATLVGVGFSLSTATADSAGNLSGTVSIGGNPTEANEGWVYLFSPTTNSYSPKATIGAGGSYSTATVSPGSYQVGVVADEFVTPDGNSYLSVDGQSNSTVTINGNTTDNINFPSNTISVTVLNSDGTPNTTQPSIIATNTSSQTTFSDANGNSYTDVSGDVIGENRRINASGTDNVSVLPNQTYKVCAIVSGTSYCDPNSVAVTGNASVTITLPPPPASSGNLSGTVSVNGAPTEAQEGWVYLYNPVSQVATPKADIGTGGAYSTVSVSPAAYEVGMAADDFVKSDGTSYLNFQGQTNKTVVNINGNQTDNMNFPANTLTVTVLNSDGTPNTSQPGIIATNTSDQTTFYDSTGAGYTDVSGDVVAENRYISTSGTDSMTVLPDQTYKVCVILYSTGTSYCYPTPVAITGNISLTITLPAPTPSAPTNLAAASPTDTNPVLTWSAAAGATSYNVYRDGTKIGSSTTTSYTDNSVTSQGTYTYTVSAVNSSGESPQSGQVSVLVNLTPPSTTASLSPNPYVDGSYSNPVSIALSATASQAGITVTNTYYTLDSGAQQTYSASFTVSGYGSHTITYWSTDNSGEVEPANTQTFVIHQPPTISTLSNATINEGGTFAQNGSFTSNASSWTATVDYGDGSGTQPLTLSGTNFALNHAFAEEGTYTVTVVITDNDGTTGTAIATVTVNNAPFTVGAISSSSTFVQINTPITASANFTDPGTLDTHTATWNWGDGTTSSGTVSENNGSGSVSDSHTYTSTGVYTITLTVTDDDGVNQTQTFYYVSVYNPNTNPAGLFSGVTKFNSPLGALTADPSLTGTVQFGITAQYDKNGNPTGNVKMNLKNANLDFASTTLNQLVIESNGLGTLRGSGTINGSGSYTFLVTGIDSKQTGGGVIRFQIKDDLGNVIYDTQPGAADTATPTTTITGNIVVH